MRNDQKALADIYSRIITESSGRKVIEGDVDLSSLYLEELPDWLSDVEIKGSFFCDENRLTTLQGGPKTVEGDFYCHVNRLTTLAGGPKTVRGNFFCYDNKLTTLAGAPKTVGGGFFCYNNRLTTLAGAPETVGGNFSCSDNPGNFTKGDVRAVSKVDGKIFV